jgi:AcrR family transcriptional regulator
MATKKKIAESGKPRRGEYHHGDLKRALMRAASELLEEVGYEGFTLRKCAQRAGVSPSAPAHHFKDAAGLLNQLAVEGFEALSSILRAAFLKSQEKNAASCRGVAMEYLRFAKANPALYKVMFGSRLHADQPDLKAATQQSFEKLQLSVAEVFPQMSPKEIRALSLRMWASVHGLALLLIENRLNFLIGKGAFKDLAALEADWLEAQAVRVL